MYRKVLTYNSISSRLNHNIDNIDQVIDYTGSIFYTTSGYNYKLPYGTTTRINLINRTYIDIYNTENWTGYPLYVTVYYTKTTD